LRRGEQRGGARLDLYEAEDRAIVSDEINLRRNERAAQASTDRQFEVGRDEAITDALQKLGGELLTALTEREMRRYALGFVLDDNFYHSIFN
jgi:hypothetical protein